MSSASFERGLHRQLGLGVDRERRVALLGLQVVEVDPAACLTST
jgi:hypothetical protein